MKKEQTRQTGMGKTQWVVPAGHIPLHSSGPEPAFSSHDKISILNTGRQPASVQLTIFYADEDPVGPYHCSVDGQRIRKLRINDLIDPLPVLLDRPYSLVVRSDQPVVVQFSRQSTGQRSCALAGGLALAVIEKQTPWS
jgi:hypothetical protein